MNLWFFLILIGLFFYLTLQRTMTKVTRTPVWLCWSVLMLPNVFWLVHAYAPKETKSLWVTIFLGSLFVCPLIYYWLVARGRIQPEPETNPSNTETNSETSNPAEPSKESQPIRPIAKTEEVTLRNCFPWGVYYLQQIDYRPQGIVCTGKLQTIPEKAYQTIDQNIHEAFGDRFFLVFQESFQGQPFFALVPNNQPKIKEQDRDFQLKRPKFALFLLFLTILTTAIVGVGISGITSPEIEANPQLIWQGLPYSLGLVSILGIQEFSQYLVCLRYKIQTTLPYFIPLPFFLGTFGAFRQRISPIPHRKAIFDIAFVGCIAGFLVTLVIFLWGLSLSEVVTIPQKNNLFSFDAIDPRVSFLFALLSKWVIGSELSTGKAIDLHPLAIAGYIGAIIMVLKLMPVGSLDGGQIVHAVYGQKTAIIVTQVTRFLMLFFALIRPYFWIWTLILWLMPTVDRPALNDVTELDNKRDLLGFVTLALLVIILLPLPNSVAAWLNL
jgi:membrane-associated protease RseP (regulator of RpoE activity)